MLRKVLTLIAVVVVAILAVVPVVSAEESQGEGSLTPPRAMAWPSCGAGPGRGLHLRFGPLPSS